MGWLDRFDAKNRAKLPKDLIDKSEDEILGLLNTASTTAAENAALKARATELENKTREQEGKVTEITSEFEKMKTRLATIDAARTRQPDPNGGTPEELANFIEDPDKAFGQRITPLAQLTLQNAAATSRILAQQQLDNMDAGTKGTGQETMDGRLFRVWGRDIDEEAKKYPIANMGTPQTWLAIFYYIKGVRADELRNPETRKKNYSFLEPATSGTPSGNGEPAKKTGVESLTDEEKRVAARMGVTPEKYAERKSKMQFVNG